MGGADSGDWLDLADALSALHEQLGEARLRAADSPIRLSVEEVTVEFGMELRRLARGDGGLRFGVVSAGGGVERTSVGTHRVTLRLNARTESGEPLDVADRDDDE
ncbi:trypco2 family protein [Kitasatospora sp. NPDC057500]|uniref:trypco2 family protein n=1 Tax=Kitasatospora sp. NPDC057500 TaxID=3346151 RepID=UPI0036966047